MRSEKSRAGLPLFIEILDFIEVRGDGGAPRSSSLPGTGQPVGSRRAAAATGAKVQRSPLPSPRKVYKKETPPTLKEADPQAPYPGTQKYCGCTRVPWYGFIRKKGSLYSKKYPIERGV